MMNEIYVLMFCHGEYDDYSIYPIGYTTNKVEAQMIADALEHKERTYIEKYFLQIGYSVQILMNEQFSFSVDVISLYKMTV